VAKPLAQVSGFSFSPPAVAAGGVLYGTTRKRI